MQKLFILSISWTIFLLQRPEGILAQEENNNTTPLEPYEWGPYPDILTFRWPFNETGLYKNVEVYAPANATGTFPVIYFSHSFAGTITVKSVDSFLFHLASHGYTIIAPWRQLAGPNYTVEWIDPTIDYAQENIVQALVDHGAEVGYSPDFSRMIAIGHSAGNHILVNYFKRKGCRSFLASILLSPVDGPIDFCITPGEPVNYRMPTLVAMAGLDPIPGTPIYPACAPSDISNMRFYNAMPSNRWFMNASDYGHADFFEPGYMDLIDFLNFCATDESTDKESYLSFVAGTCVAFMEALLGSGPTSCEMLSYIEDPTLLAPINVTASFHVDDPATKCNAFCTHTPLTT